MQELIKIESRDFAGSEVQTVSARDLHAFLEMAGDFNRWVALQIERARLTEGRDYLSYTDVGNPLGGRPRVETALTLDAAKHIAMMSQSDKGFEVRDYFIDCERIAKATTQPTARLGNKFQAEMMLVSAVADALNVSPSARLGMIRTYVANQAPDVVPTLPVYTIDAPTGSASAASSETTGSLNTLLKKHGVTFSAIKVNQILIDFGLLEERTRPSTSGSEQRKFKAITEAGLQYGKNVTNPANQKEVQPHWYESTFSRLLQHVGLSLAVK